MTVSQITSQVLKDLVYWLFFGVIIALAQLWLIPFGYYLTSKSVTWVQLVGNGSLLFFSTTITSQTAGEYFKKPKAHNAAATLLCIVPTLGIIILSVCGYGLVIATQLGMLPANSLSAERVTTVSDILAIAGMIFSFGFTIYLRVFGE